MISRDSEIFHLAFSSVHFTIYQHEALWQENFYVVLSVLVDDGSTADSGLIDREMDYVNLANWPHCKPCPEEIILK